VVIRNSAANIVLVYVIRLRESSVMSLTTRAQKFRHTATNEGVSDTQGIMARGAGDARADRGCLLTITAL
jgi:hypothetical protein